MTPSSRPGRSDFIAAMDTGLRRYDETARRQQLTDKRYCGGCDRRIAGPMRTTLHFVAASVAALNKPSTRAAPSGFVGTPWRPEITFPHSDVL